MKAFEFKQGDQPWEAGAGTLLHFYAEVDWDDPRHEALARLVSAANAALLDAGFPITPVEPRWLHITIDQVSRPAHLIGQNDRDHLIEEVTTRLGSVAPFEISVGSLLSYHSGVIADLSPDQQLAALHASVRDGIRAALGEDACHYSWGVQHLTTAYAHASADSDAAQRILRRIRPSHAPLLISAIHLVDVSACATGNARSITWENLTTIRLNTAASAPFSLRASGGPWWHAGRMVSYCPPSHSEWRMHRWTAALYKAAGLLEPVWPRNYSTGPFTYALETMALLLYAGEYSRDLPRQVEHVPIDTLITAFAARGPQSRAEDLIRDGLVSLGHHPDAADDDVSALFRNLTADHPPFETQVELPSLEQPRAGSTMQWGSDWAWHALTAHYQRAESSAGAGDSPQR